MLGNKIAEKLDNKLIKPLESLAASTLDLSNHVIIAGFGEIGAMAAKVLDFENINYVIIDANETLIQDAIESGFPALQGDVSQLEALKSLGAASASVIILTIKNDITIKKATRIVSLHFPNIKIIVRSPNLVDANNLYQAGADIIIPENYENGLQIGGAALRTLGISEYEIARIKGQFRAGNYTVAKQRDEDAIIERS
jgi:CPA2 family monovalent cation:H+ antiporter-2